jgi:hypothetical protein
VARQAIAIVKEKPALQTLFSEVEELWKDINKRADFLKRQAEKLSEDSEVLKKQFWDKVEQYLRSNNMLPETFSKSVHHFDYDSDAGGVLYMCDGKHHKSEIINILLKG